MPAKIPKQQPKNGLLEALREIQQVNSPASDKEKIVDIITFCDSKEFLDLPRSNFDLWLAQRVILKTFYMGTRGNENLRLNQEEWEWLYKNADDEELDGMTYEKNCRDVIKKLKDREKLSDNEKPILFNELILVLGRRASKTIMASVISAYEVYKLMVVGDGNPQRFYGLPDDDEIVVINVALSQEQAGRLFGQIQARLRNSPFFEGKIAKETTKEIRLYTKADLDKKKKGSSLEVPGSIKILCGHSDPKTLRGFNAILILFDELAFYDDSGKVTGQEFYNALKPSTKHFNQYGDGRLVEISSPSGQNCIFYDIFANSHNDLRVLSYQLPTWCVNDGIKYEELESDRTRNPDAFAVEYGAQWAKGGVFGNYFPEEIIDRSIRTDIGPMIKPDPSLRLHYYMHVDPANGGDRYVAVMVGRENYVNHMGEKRIRVRLVNVWVWEPTPGVGLIYNDINRDVLNICRVFRPRIVTYDQYNSIQSLQFLKSHGIKCAEKAFNNTFKMKIYQNLKDMMSYTPHPELWIYDDHRLILEMRALKFKTIKRGLTLVKDKKGIVSTDDVVDCLAGAASEASGNVIMPLPAPTTVRMGYI